MKSNSVELDQPILEFGELGETGYEIIKPIPYTVGRENGEFIAEVKELELYAFSRSRKKAVKEIRFLLLDMYDRFAEKPQEKLGPDPLKWKNFLMEHIRRDAE